MSSPTTPSSKSGDPPKPPGDRIQALVKDIESWPQSAHISTVEKNYRDVLQQLAPQLASLEAWRKNAEAFLASQKGQQYESARAELERIYDPIAKQEEAVRKKEQDAEDTRRKQDDAEKAEKERKDEIDKKLKKLKDTSGGHKQLQEKARQLIETLFSETDEDRRAMQAAALAYALTDLQNAADVGEVERIAQDVNRLVREYVDKERDARQQKLAAESATRALEDAKAELARLKKLRDEKLQALLQPPKA